MRRHLNMSNRQVSGISIQFLHFLSVPSADKHSSLRHRTRERTVKSPCIKHGSVVANASGYHGGRIRSITRDPGLHAQMQVIKSSVRRDVVIKSSVRTAQGHCSSKADERHCGVGVTSRLSATCRGCECDAADYYNNNGMC